MQHKQQERELFNVIAIALVFAGALFLALLALYFWQFHDGLSTEQATWGQFGDFLGGTLNPLLGFMSVVLLAFTLRAQHRVLDELAASRFARNCSGCSLATAKT